MIERIVLYFLAVGATGLMALGVWALFEHDSLQAIACFVAVYLCGRAIGEM